MLYSAIPATAVLVIGFLAHWTTDAAVDGALIASVATLGVLGYSAYSLRGASQGVRIAGALGTAALGLILLILNVLTH